MQAHPASHNATGWLGGGATEWQALSEAKWMLVAMEHLQASSRVVHSMRNRPLPSSVNSHSSLGVSHGNRAGSLASRPPRIELLFSFSVCSGGNTRWTTRQIVHKASATDSYYREEIAALPSRLLSATCAPAATSHPTRASQPLPARRRPDRCGLCARCRSLCELRPCTYARTERYSLVSTNDLAQ